MFSSKDFDKVPSSLQPRIVEPLVHKSLNVKSNRKSAFSKERQHFVSIADLPSHSMSMTLGGLEPGQSTRKHRHNYETLIYVIEGTGMSRIEGKEYCWEKGDAFYVPVWAWHEHCNLSDKDSCLYIACENTPMLQNIGQIALREESN